MEKVIDFESKKLLKEYKELVNSIEKIKEPHLKVLGLTHLSLWLTLVAVQMGVPEQLVEKMASEEGWSYQEIKDYFGMLHKYIDFYLYFIEHFCEAEIKKELRDEVLAKV